MASVVAGIPIPPGTDTVSRAPPSSRAGQVSGNVNCHQGGASLVSTRSTHFTHQ